VEESSSNWTLRIANRNRFSQGENDVLLCAFMIGLLQEYLSWAGMGKNYLVDETECRGAGAPACVFLINRQPIE
ncbi:MAG TPA: 4-vinyl reductase, partial [Longilinea sp.]|nr:4-vinyl reductase [Longilinea sp.]